MANTLTKQEQLEKRVGKVIEKSFRAKIKNKDGKAVGYFDVQLFGFAEDAKAQASLERSLELITNHLPQ
jgi:hypothetical protein